MPTNEELVELGKKALAAKEKDKARTKKAAEAVRKLINAHRDEYEGYLKGREPCHSSLWVLEYKYSKPSSLLRR